MASSNFVHFTQTLQPVTSPTTGYERPVLETVDESTHANTNYVLDENKNLIEVRSSEYRRHGWNYSITPISDVTVRYSGGTPQDHYHALDGTAYLGRWRGGQMDVYESSIASVPFLTHSLGAQSAHWIVALTPGYSSTIADSFGPVPNVQTVIGSRSYTLTAATSPTDAFGNVGTLNSASLSANFTSLTVDSHVEVGFLGRGISALRSQATNLPIAGRWFETDAPTITCSGDGCSTAAPSGWAGEISGEFGGTASGAVGAGAALGYQFVPVVPSESEAAYTDFIHGIALFNTTTAPDPGVTQTFANNSSVRHGTIYTTPNGAGEFYLPVANSFIGITNPTTTTLGSSALTVSTNYLFDASGNLVRIFDTPYAIFDRGTNLGNVSGFATPSLIENAQISFGGGGSVAAESYFDSGSGLRMGRWQGGFVTVVDLLNELGYLEPLGSRSVHWVVYQKPTSLPLSGSFHYTRFLGTAPTDSYGNVGTLEAATLAVDFARLRTSAGVRILMPQGPGGSLGTARIAARYNDAPLNGNGEINVSSNPAESPSGLDRLFVGCTGNGCAPNTGYGGRIRGGFSGLNAEGAWLRYSLHTNYADPAAAAANERAYQEYTNGAVGLQKGPAIVQPSTNVLSPASNPPGDALILSAYSWLNNITCSPTPCTQTQTEHHEAAGTANAWVATPGYAIDGSGNLTFMSENLWPDDGDSLTVSGGTGATNASANGIRHGYYLQGGASPLTLNGSDWNGPVTNRQPLDSFHWLVGPVTHPFFTADAAIMPFNATSNINYQQLGAFATDQNGAAALSVSATLGVNFNRQALDTSLTALMSNGMWNAAANGIALDEGSFWISSGNEPKRSFTTLEFTPTGSITPMSAWGSMNGSLMGPGLNGAGLAFAFGTGGGDRATGTAVFGNPTYNDGSNPTAPYQLSDFMNYRMIIGTFGMTNAGAVTRDGTPFGSGGELVDEEENYRVAFGAASSGRVQMLPQSTASNPVAGSVVKFDASTPVVTNHCSPSGVCNSVNRIPVVLAVADSSGFGPTVTNVATAPTARNLEFSFDADTGISWGRWGGGTINVGDRNSSNQAGAVPTNNAGGTATQIDATVRNLHYLISPSQTGPVVLPTTDISGTFTTYTFVGGTSPTAYTSLNPVFDVGTLNSATLTAHFSAAIPNVDVSVSASTPGSGTWAASASNIPILAGQAFFAGKSLDGTGALTVTRDTGSGPSPANTAGQIIGGFSGPTGKGAGFGYALNQNGPAGTTINGVAVFKRP